MQTGKIGVTTDNIFPIIKKFLYSDHEIFLRELVSNAVDATRKLQALAQAGEYGGELGDLTVQVKLDKEAKTITVSDRGIGMTQEEVEKYINQIAFSSAGEFLDKYKDKIDAIIGHFGLGFYSSFMVAAKVEIHTLSHKEGATAVKWECDGSPNYTLDTITKDSRGTDIILHVDSESEDFLEQSKLKDLLKKYCKFLPIPIGFGKEQEWKDGKYEDTDKSQIINDTAPAWTRKPADLKEDDYQKFYRDLYPSAYEEPLFNIHLNVDYPFNLTGILYFPRLKKNIDIQKNKIQLYCNQVFVTDTVEGIVPDFLTLLHGVIDSPDIPLNVSRSYLQSDSNVKKISGHINKKVADRLNEIFKNSREDFEKKWDDLKLFIQYGCVSDEKFYERALSFFLFKNLDGKYFTIEEYENLVKTNQTDKDNKVTFIYTTDSESQHTFIDSAKAKGYDILLMDGQLDTHFIHHLESKKTTLHFTRVDSDVPERLIRKDDKKESSLSKDVEENLTSVFESQAPSKGSNFTFVFESLGKDELPIIITRSEFMRRMKEMSATGSMGFHYDMPDNVNMVVNSDHELISGIIKDINAKHGNEIKTVMDEISTIQKEVDSTREAQKGKKDEEIPQADKDFLNDIENKLTDVKDKKDKLLTEYGKGNHTVKQLIDLALLSNNMLKGEDLSRFVRRSVSFIK